MVAGVPGHRLELRGFFFPPSSYLVPSHQLNSSDDDEGFFLPSSPSLFACFSRTKDRSERGSLMMMTTEAGGDGTTNERIVHAPPTTTHRRTHGRTHARTPPPAYDL